MRLRFPLYGKVLFWFFVNLVLVAALAYGFVRMQFRIGLDWLLAGPARQRLEAMGEVIAGELRDQPKPVWNEALARYQVANGASFTIFRNDGVQAAGEALQPPAEVMEKLRDRRGPPSQAQPPRREDRPPRADRPPPEDRPPEERPPRDDRAQEPRRDGNPPPTRIAYMLRTESPVRYWVGLHIGLTHMGPPDPRPVTLLISSDRITGGGLFFDPLPWVALGAGALILSALVWLPIVSGITRAIRRVNTAARSIAKGRFDVRVPETRRDELGELGGSVNAMAAQLGDLVEKQRRLTADVAHELCSPIARMQRALGVVEQRATPEQAGYLAKLDGELQHMAKLVEEVLSFTKASSLPATEAPLDFSLADLIVEVVAREAADARVEVQIPADLRLHTFRGALDRALSNLLRNAVRYAGKAGPIEIRAVSDGDTVEITVRDHGPGVPAESLPRIFEPFYRPEAARQRTTGGAGLGLAIVKSCIEACGGSVAARNCDPHGLQAEIMLPLRSGA
jgi:two-component system sensor histidine kinase CpxA